MTRFLISVGLCAGIAAPALAQTAADAPDAFQTAVTLQACGENGLVRSAFWRDLSVSPPVLAVECSAGTMPDNRVVPAEEVTAFQPLLGGLGPAGGAIAGIVLVAAAAGGGGGGNGTNGSN